MELSLVANFDDLRRCNDVLTDGTAEIEYRRFLEVQEDGRQQWRETTIEAQRLQKELDKCARERGDLETKLFHARRLLDMEIKARQDAEKERAALEQKLSRVCEYLRNDRDMNDEVRNKYAYLDHMESNRKVSSKRKSQKFAQESSEDLNNTGSFLSNLSVTQSEEDFLDVQCSVGDNRPKMKKHRPSESSGPYTEAKSSRRSRRSIGDHQVQRKVNVIDLDQSDKIVATTKVSIPQDDGPIEATSTIEAVPNSNHYNRIDFHESTYETPNNKENSFNIPNETPYKRNFNGNNSNNSNAIENKTQSNYQRPSAPALQEVGITNSKLLLNLQGRHHAFTNKTILINESCFKCQKKLRFGSTALKCRTCGLLIHPDCKFQISATCVPKNPAATPMKKGEQGLIADYVPGLPGLPMVPALIVHCINEVEMRGLTEKGIYRQCGSTKDIKELKEKFLRGKSVPALGDIDVHVICGCIKDFLRNLREPLIPTHLWKKFANAAQCTDDKQSVRDLYITINQLPQANRDTMAFLMLHLQRVATCEATKMSIENLALVFGPTIMGYSSHEIDECTFRAESSIQKDVVEKLLTIPTDYWSRFISVAIESDSENDKVSVHSFFGTPGMRPLNASIRRRKYFETPPHTCYDIKL